MGCASFWSRAPTGLRATSVCRSRGTTTCARSGSSWCRRARPLFHDRYSDCSARAAGARKVATVAFVSQKSLYGYCKYRSVRRIIQIRGHSCADPAAKPLFGSQLTLSDRFCTPTLIRPDNEQGMAHVPQIELGCRRFDGRMLVPAGVSLRGDSHEIELVCISSIRRSTGTCH
jgi:hypothetical protein